MSAAPWAVVVAAGRGERFGAPGNKVFCKLNGRTVLLRCLDALESSGCYGGAVLVLSEQDLPRYQALLQQEGASMLVQRVVTGGATRQRSVYNGLLAVPPEVDIVSIHDAARCMTPISVIRASVESAKRFESGVSSTHLTDTIQRVDETGCVLETLDRSTLRAVQTPQSFVRAGILSAHEQAMADGFQATDDAALWARYVSPARLVDAPGGTLNRKLTTREDFQALIKPEYRVGHGYDAHRLVAGRALVLCGVCVPFDRGLQGHSDADVATHALMDALLGAMAMPDIGHLFPDTDPRYAGICSLTLLREVGEKAAERGYTLSNADVTVAAQAPKLAPFIPQMRARLAEALGTAVANVSVKATTTEGMGFEGRGEGISAQAVVLLSCFKS